MKKIIAICVGICIVQLHAFAQGIQLGVRAGVNRGTLSTEFPNFIEGPVQTAFTGGAFGRLSLLGFFVQPELMFSQHKGSFKDTTTGSYTNRLNYFSINAMFGYSIVGVLRFNIGPSFGMLLGANQNSDLTQLLDPDFNTSNFNQTYWGLQLGGGVDLGKICIDIRWETNLTDMGKSVTTASGVKNYSTSTNQLTFTVGYKIIKI